MSCGPNDVGKDEDANQMADATDELSKLMSDALMVMLLSMTMSYLMLLTKLTRCIMMTDADAQSYLTLMEMLPSLLTAVVIDDAARCDFRCWPSPDD